MVAGSSSNVGAARALFGDAATVVDADEWEERDVGYFLFDDILCGDTSQRTSFAQSSSVYIDFLCSSFLRRLRTLPAPLEELRVSPLSDVAGVVARVEAEGAEPENEVGQLDSDTLGEEASLTEAVSNAEFISERAETDTGADEPR